jgi:hypothetical protein
MITFLIRFRDGHQCRVRAKGFSAAIAIAIYRRMRRQGAMITHAQSLISEKDCEVIRHD